MSAPALYVHIPFCTSFCPYCDFPKAFYEEDRIEPYFSSLYKEIKAKAEGPYDTIYVGGGTPTCVSPEKLDEYLSLLRNYLAENGEFSIEANPETLTEEKIKEFEKDVAEGKNVNIKDYIENESKDYSNKITNFGDDVSELINDSVNFVLKGGFKFIEKMIN